MSRRRAGKGTLCRSHSSCSPKRSAATCAVCRDRTGHCLNLAISASFLPALKQAKSTASLASCKYLVGRLRAWTFRIISCASCTVLGSSTVCCRMVIEAKGSISCSCGFMELAGGIFTLRVSDCRPLHSTRSFTCTSGRFEEDCVEGVICLCLPIFIGRQFRRRAISRRPRTQRISAVQTVSCVLPCC